MKHFFLIVFFIGIMNLSAQEWSEPVNISNMSGTMAWSDFCVDNNGYCHVVWSYKIEQNFQQIYYAKSEDGGETWSEPINISQNDEMWMDGPKIVVDSQGNIYVGYSYNCGNTSATRVYMAECRDDFWYQPYPICDAYGPHISAIAIDHNDRVYVFSMWNTYAKYCYLIGGVWPCTEWSEWICPYSENVELTLFKEVVVDSDNNLHCIIVYNTANYLPNASYAKYNYALDSWEPAVVIVAAGMYGADICLNNSDYPHLAWLAGDQDACAYSYFDGEAFTEPEIIIIDPLHQTIVIDANDTMHLIEVEKFDQAGSDESKLVYYTSDNAWEGTVIVENGRLATTPQLEIYDNQLYLVYFNVPDVTDCDMFFMKKDLPVEANNDNYIEALDFVQLSQNYPNPSSSQTSINFSLKKGGKTVLKILNIRGQTVKTLVDEQRAIGSYTALWDGTDNYGKPVASGVYFYRLMVENRVKTKKLTLVK
ncbi:MAG: T9SS type A sorting domain-containing protein [Candidatus Cloacimonetes bacterium]|nr:T9SS type A sorting domain-containing protein [Candidatus Cloacimonadota bacterium]MBT6993787.1 T9SS type A sorting domain-containing protein [Candidatus Cloacimonadota bacterium]